MYFVVQCVLMVNHLGAATVRSDLQVCASGSAAGNMAIILKQFAQLGIPNWMNMASKFEMLGVTDVKYVFLATEIQVDNVYTDPTQWNRLIE